MFEMLMLDLERLRIEQEATCLDSRPQLLASELDISQRFVVLASKHKLHLCQHQQIQGCYRFYCLSRRVKDCVVVWFGVDGFLEYMSYMSRD